MGILPKRFSQTDRRSYPQPMRKFWITAGVLIALAVLAAILGSLWIGSYVRGSGFRDLVSDATGAAFHAEAGFDPLRWTGSSVYSESLKLEGKSGTALNRIDARQLRAEVNWRALLSGTWRIEEISVSRLDGDWSPAGARAQDPHSAPVVKSPAGIAALLPRRFELGILKIASARLGLGNVRVSDSALTIKPDGAGWIFQGSGGELQLPRPPALAITNFRVREQGGDYFLLEANLRLGANGKISASGESSRGGKLQVAWTGVPAAELLPPDWRDRLDGTLSGRADIAFPRQANGEFLLLDGRLENIPLQATVAKFTGNPAFRRMPLQEIRGEFVWDGDLLHIQKFSAESKGLVRVEGEATLGPNGKLAGRFQLGVTAQTLQWLPGSRKRVFTDARNGYVWTPLILGGTLESPTEDLSSRLAAAMGAEVIDTGTNLIKTAPDAATKGVNGILDVLRPLLP